MNINAATQVTRYKINILNKICIRRINHIIPLSLKTDTIKKILQTVNTSHVKPRKKTLPLRSKKIHSIIENTPIIEAKNNKLASSLDSIRLVQKIATKITKRTPMKRSRAPKILFFFWI